MQVPVSHSFQFAAAIAAVILLFCSPGFAQRVLLAGQTVVDPEEPGLVRGEVLNESGEPVAGLVIVLHRPRVASSRSFPEPWVADIGGADRAVAKVSTDERGRFSFGGRVPSRYTVRPRRAGIGGGTMHLVLTPEQNTIETTLRVELGGILRGVVVDGAGEPVEKAWVFVSGQDLGDGLNRMQEPRPARVRTGPAGRFVLLGVPRGVVYLQAARRALGWSQPTPISMQEERVREGLRIVLQEDQDRAAFGGKGGIGVGLDFTPAGPVVDRVYEGSPAAAAGIRALDLIEEVDGRRTRFMSPEEFRSRCRGPADTEVSVSLLRPDGLRRSLTLTRAADPWGEPK